MFKYQDNGKLSKEGETQRKIVMQARKVTYVNKYRRDGKTFEKTSEGWEIVRERVVSPEFKAPERIALTGEHKTVVIKHSARVERKEEE